MFLGVVALISKKNLRIGNSRTNRPVRGGGKKAGRVTSPLERKPGWATFRPEGPRRDWEPYTKIGNMKGGSGDHHKTWGRIRGWDKGGKTTGVARKKMLRKIVQIKKINPVEVKGPFIKKSPGGPVPISTTGAGDGGWATQKKRNH